MLQKEEPMRKGLFVFVLSLAFCLFVSPVCSAAKGPEMRDGEIYFPEPDQTVSLSKLAFSFPPDCPKEILNIRGKIFRGELTRAAGPRMTGAKNVTYLIPLGYSSDTKEMTVYFVWEKAYGGKPAQGKLQGLFDLENGSPLRPIGTPHITQEHRLYFLKDGKLRINVGGGASGDYTTVGNLPQ